jgi:hypothetical protein
LTPHGALLYKLRKEDPMKESVETIEKAEYQGREVTLDKPFRLPSGSSKKFGVYVKDGDKVKKVTFGDPNMEIRRDDPDARANFRSRHSCDTQKDKTSAAYWSCRMWDKDVSVSELTKSIEVGDKVRWTSSGGTARGVVRQIVRDGTVPNIPVKITGTEDEPAARIELLDDEGKPRGEFVGHKLDSLRKGETIEKSSLDGEIFRVDNEQRIVWGWASVTKVGGDYVVDRHGHVITSDTMTKAATAFMEKSLRAAKTEHYGDPVGAVVHSLPMTQEIAKALGITCEREGWIIGMKIYDDGVWQMVKTGEFPAFSIGGQGALMELGE